MFAFGGCNDDPDAWDVKQDLLAYGCGPCLILYDLESATTFSYFPLHYGIITCVSFISSSRLILGTSFGFVLLVDPLDKKVLSQLNFQQSVTHISVSDNGSYILISLVEGIHLLSLTNYQNALEILPVRLHSAIRCISHALFFFQGSLIIALAHPDGQIQVFIPNLSSEEDENYSPEKSGIYISGSTWVQSLCFCEETPTSILLAAGSQDCYVRIWRISTAETSKVSRLGLAILDQTTLNALNSPLHIELYQTLKGHTSWVNSVAFYGPETLASASSDGHLILWKLEDESYDIVSRKGTTNQAVEADQSGFIGVKLLDSDSPIAVSRNGGFSRWFGDISLRAPAGHFDDVTSLCWSPDLRLFISTSLDKTARVWHPVPLNSIDSNNSIDSINSNNLNHSKDQEEEEEEEKWTEVARPLIHGHSMFGALQISENLFAFASDEKNIRILTPTSTFAERFGEPFSSMDLPYASVVPALSLQNSILKTSEEVSRDFAPLTGDDFVFDHNPPSSHEMWLTRWPEVDSRWGHLREIRVMCQTNDRSWFASADDRGGVCVWPNGRNSGNIESTGNIENDRENIEKERQKRFYLTESSKSMATGLAAAPDSSLLLETLENGTFRVIDPFSTDGRVIIEKSVAEHAYGAAWSENGEYFAIGCEKGLALFERDGNPAALFSGIETVTAIEFLNDYNMIVGTINGQLKKVKYDASERTFEIVKNYEEHGGRVNTIKANLQSNQVISGGSDHVILLQTI